MLAGRRSRRPASFFRFVGARIKANASIDPRRNDPRIARTIPAMRIERERTSLKSCDSALQMVTRSAARRRNAAASTRRTLKWNMGTAT
jgi:hypothetical protein